MTTQTAPIESPVLTVTDVAPFTGLCFTTRTTLADMAQFHGLGNDLRAEAARLNAEITGPTQWIYTDVTGDVTREFQLDIVVPVSLPVGKPDAAFAGVRFDYKRFRPFRCVSYVYTGPWSELMGVYDVLFAQFHRDGYQNDGRVREIYSVVDLVNPDRCVTEIQLGLA